MQDLRYTYDPAGNITRIEDAALKTIFHNGQQVEPVCDYTYDAIYRLIEASGREHIGQTAFDFNRRTATGATIRSPGLPTLSPIRTICRRCATTPSGMNTTPSATSKCCVTSPTAAVGRAATTTTKPA